MTKNEIIKRANSFRGANREFSQEMGPIVEGILDYVDDSTEPLEDKLDAPESAGTAGQSLMLDSEGNTVWGDNIPAPATAGTENQMLAINSHGDPQWVTPAAGSTVDTEMSDNSPNPVQNKVIKEYVDTYTADNYARKDGYYSQLTAGSAENLVGQTVDSEAYLIRTTAGAENEVANGAASVLSMEGNSCVWNQLVQNGNFSNGTNYWNILRCTVVVDGGIAEITKTSDNYGGVFYSTSVIANSTHKYYICANTKATEGSALYIGFLANNGLEGGNTILSNVSTEFTKIMGIVTPTSNTDILSVRVGVGSTPIGTKGYVKNFICVDLTLLGIDNLTTTAQVEAWLAQHVGTKPYYDYNAGTILSAQTLGIKTYGQNLLNPTTKQAKLIPYTWVENGTTYSNQYTIKNVPSGATATFTPDNTGVAVTVDISSGTLDITSYGSGVLELSAATANTYVCIKWNGTKDDDVVPYEDHTYDFDVRNIYGKVNGEGEYIQCFPNGLKGIGSVKDTLNASEAVSKIGSVNLGSLTWTYNSSKSRFESTSLNGLIKGFTVNTAPNIICAKYIRYTANIGDTLGGITSFIENSLSYIRVVDDNYTSAASFKTAMNGVMLNYELATPITYTDLIYRDNGVDRPLADVLMNITVNNWSMEEQLLTPYEDGNPTSIPATIKTQYGMDAVEAIDTLQKACYFADDIKANLQALLTCINTNCAETLGGTFAISETATDKVFEFTFTPNVEPEP